MFLSHKDIYTPVSVGIEYGKYFTQIDAFFSKISHVSVEIKVYILSLIFHALGICSYRDQFCPEFPERFKISANEGNISHHKLSTNTSRNSHDFKNFN